MSLAHIDPLFNPLTKPAKLITEVQASVLVSATERPPISPYSNTPMQLVEGAYEGKVFSMWVDVGARQTIPVKAKG